MNSYAKLVGLDLKHGYYRSGWCGDFDVSTGGETETQFKNHRCVVKTRPGGLDAYIEVDASGKPLIPLAKDSVLTFDLSLRNPEFLLFTDAAPLAGGADYQLTYPEQKSAGRYFGVVVKRDFSHLPGGNLQLSFSAKKMLWVYYVVTDRGGADTDYAIVAADPLISWKFDNRIDDIATKLAQQYPGKRVLRFSSEALLPCREDGLSGIRLLVAGIPIMENLPTPSWRNFFKTRKAAAGGDVDAMFQVVTYLSNTSLTKV